MVTTSARLCWAQSQTNKTGRSVTIPLAAPILNYLVTQAATPDTSNTFVHPELAEAYAKSSSTASNQFTSLLVQCGLWKAASHSSKNKGRNTKREKSTLSFHSLRVTAVTMLYEAGFPAATVEEWVGHNSTEVHQTYIKIGRESLMKASSSLPAI